MTAGYDEDDDEEPGTRTGGHEEDRRALTSHLDSGRVSPECSSPAGLLVLTSAGGGAMASGIG